MRRRVMMVLAAMAVMVTLFAAAAYAATIEGTSQGDILLDSQLNDTIFGRGGGDEIRADAFGLEGFLTCGDPPAPCDGADTDVAKGNAGSDFINVDDGDTRDTATGGDGNDFCVGDTLAELNCENESVGTGVAGGVAGLLGPQ
jgi:Ca2+-binding RTX toxin-like protein